MFSARRNCPKGLPLGADFKYIATGDTLTIHFSLFTIHSKNSASSLIRETAFLMSS